MQIKLVYAGSRRFLGSPVTESFVSFLTLDSTSYLIACVVNDGLIAWVYSASPGVQYMMLHIKGKGANSVSLGIR